MGANHSSYSKNSVPLTEEEISEITCQLPIIWTFFDQEFDSIMVELSARLLLNLPTAAAQVSYAQQQQQRIVSEGAPGLVGASPINSLGSPLVSPRAVPIAGALSSPRLHGLQSDPDVGAGAGSGGRPQAIQLPEALSNSINAATAAGGEENRMSENLRVAVLSLGYPGLRRLVDAFAYIASHGESRGHRQELALRSRKAGDAFDHSTGNYYIMNSNSFSIDGTASGSAFPAVLRMANSGVTTAAAANSNSTSVLVGSPGPRRITSPAAEGAVAGSGSPPHGGGGGGAAASPTNASISSNLKAHNLHFQSNAGYTGTAGSLGATESSPTAASNTLASSGANHSMGASTSLTLGGGGSSGQRRFAQNTSNGTAATTATATATVGGAGGGNSSLPRSLTNSTAHSDRRGVSGASLANSGSSLLRSAVHSSAASFAERNYNSTLLTFLNARNPSLLGGGGGGVSNTSSSISFAPSTFSANYSLETSSAQLPRQPHPVPPPNASGGGGPSLVTVTAAGTGVGSFSASGSFRRRLFATQGLDGLVLGGPGGCTVESFLTGGACLRSGTGGVISGYAGVDDVLAHVLKFYLEAGTGGGGAALSPRRRTVPYNDTQDRVGSSGRGSFITEAPYDRTDDRGASLARHSVAEVIRGLSLLFAHLHLTEVDITKLFTCIVDTVVDMQWAYMARQSLLRSSNGQNNNSNSCSSSIGMLSYLLYPFPTLPNSSVVLREEDCSQNPASTNMDLRHDIVKRLVRGGIAPVLSTVHLFLAFSAGSQLTTAELQQISGVRDHERGKLKDKEEKEKEREKDREKEELRGSRQEPQKSAHHFFRTYCPLSSANTAERQFSPGTEGEGGAAAAAKPENPKKKSSSSSRNNNNNSSPSASDANNNNNGSGTGEDASNKTEWTDLLFQRHGFVLHYAESTARLASAVVSRNTSRIPSRNPSRRGSLVGQSPNLDAAAVATGGGGNSLTPSYNASGGAAGGGGGGGAAPQPPAIPAVPVLWPLRTRLLSLRQDYMYVYDSIASTVALLDGKIVRPEKEESSAILGERHTPIALFDLARSSNCAPSEPTSLNHFNMNGSEIQLISTAQDTEAMPVAPTNSYKGEKEGNQLRQHHPRFYGTIWEDVEVYRVEDQSGEMYLLTLPVSSARDAEDTVYDRKNSAAAGRAPPPPQSFYRGGVRYETMHTYSIVKNNDEDVTLTVFPLRILYEGVLHHFFFQNASERARWFDCISEHIHTRQTAGHLALVAAAQQSTSAFIKSRLSYPCGPSAFECVQMLGAGNFGRVLLVRHRLTGRQFALKTIRKAGFYGMRNIVEARREYGILDSLNCPYIMKIHATFQTDSRVYFLFDYLPGGELLMHTQRAAQHRFDEATSRFFIAELAIAVEHMRREGIVHRDIKGENLVLDDEGHVVLSDFGFAKKICVDVSEEAVAAAGDDVAAAAAAVAAAAAGAGALPAPGRRQQGGGKRRRVLLPQHTTCGTLAYIAPEVLCSSKSKSGYGLEVDWWSTGVVLFTLLTGFFPFLKSNQQETSTAIVSGPLQFPPQMHLSSAAKDLLAQLLAKDPRERITNLDALKRHPFFDGFDWRACEQRRLRPPVRLHKDTYAKPSSSSSAARKLKESVVQALTCNLPPDPAAAAAAGAGTPLSGRRSGGADLASPTTPQSRRQPTAAAAADPSGGKFAEEFAEEREELRLCELAYGASALPTPFRAENDVFSILYARQEAGGSDRDITELANCDMDFTTESNNNNTISMNNNSEALGPYIPKYSSTAEYHLSPSAPGCSRGSSSGALSYGRSPMRSPRASGDQLGALRSPRLSGTGGGLVPRPPSTELLGVGGAPSARGAANNNNNNSVNLVFNGNLRLEGSMNAGSRRQPGGVDPGDYTFDDEEEWQFRDGITVVDNGGDDYAPVLDDYDEDLYGSMNDLRQVDAVIGSGNFYRPRYSFHSEN